MKKNTALPHETTYSAWFMKENPGKASLVGPTRHFSFTESGTGWSVNSGSIWLTSHGPVWKGATHEHTPHTIQKSADRFRGRPTTLGMNGGLSFRVRRSSQLMGAKKECSCSSAWTHTEIRAAGVCCVWYASLLAVHSQGHGSLPNAWRCVFPVVPATVTGQPGSTHHAAARVREERSQTSLPCFGYKMEAVTDRSKRVKGEDAARGDVE